MSSERPNPLHVSPSPALVPRTPLRRTLDPYSPSLLHDRHFYSPLVAPQVLQPKTCISLKPVSTLIGRYHKRAPPRESRLPLVHVAHIVLDPSQVWNSRTWYQLGRNRSFGMFHCTLFILDVPFSVPQLPPLPSYVAAPPSALLTMCPPAQATSPVWTRLTTRYTRPTASTSSNTTVRLHYRYTR